MLRLKLIAVVALGAMLSGCMSDGTSLDSSLGGGLGALGGGGLGNINLGSGLGGALGTSPSPDTAAYVKQELARRGI